MILGIPQFDDDEVNFLTEVDSVVRGMVALHRPPRFAVVRIDNWFGSKWLRFAGKALGAFGVWDNKHVVVPPFVSNRITAQSSFEHSIDLQYLLSAERDKIHHNGPSSHNLQRRVTAVLPNTALFWFSGNSKPNGRGSLMGYTPLPDKYWGWYLEFSRKPEWKITHAVDFHDNEIKLANRELATLIGT